MSIKNRELSQFGSFVYIEDSTKNIGITTELTPYVGIGTTSPQKKLHVVGDILIEGNLTYNGSLEFGNIDLNTTGIFTAFAFYNTLGEKLVAFDSWIQNESNIYRQTGNVGIGVSIPSQKLDVLGNISATTFISTVTTGTPAFNINSQTLITNLNSDYLRGGIPGSNINSYDIVTIGADQTLSNKTLISPSISGALKYNSVAFNSPSEGSYNITIPAENGTLLTSSSPGIIVGVVTTGNIQNLTILNEDIANGTITNQKLVNSTISGVSLGSNLNNLISGNFINFSVGNSYNGSSPITVSVAATTTNSANTIVSRNQSGDFSAGTINVVNLIASQTVQAQDINYVSDENLKINIETVQNSIDIVSKLRGVSFDWKNSKKSSYGVIAQEIEKILPELVTDGEIKTVNYTGLIAILIEAVKELSNEINNIKI